MFPLTFGLIFPLAVLVAGIVLLNLSSDKAVEHSVFIALTLGISPLMIGLVLVSIGTDLPEMANSLVSCWSGHGDIDLGDSIGSSLTQISLVLGLIAFLGRGFRVKRREILVMGAFLIIALLLTISVALTGFTREKAFLLMACWPLFIYIIRKATRKDGGKKEHAQARVRTERHYTHHLAIAILGFVGVAIGAFAVVQSVILLSQQLAIHEFFISFFALAIGTSLPELVVDLAAVRRRQYEIAIADVIGSCIVDSTISVSIGQLFFPTGVFSDPSGRSVLLAAYAILVSAIVILTLALREKLDRKSGILFFTLYAFSYVMLYVA